MISETRPQRLRRPAGTGSGDVTIAYHSVPGKSPAMVFMTGYRSEMGGAKALALEAYCLASGRAFIRFDYQGHGESGGDFESATMSTWIGDALAVVDQLTEGPLILVGSSMGGWIMVRVALARAGRVRALLGISVAPDFTEHLMWELFDEPTRASISAGNTWRTPSREGYNEIVVTRALIEDGRQHLVLGAPIPVHVPVRLVHGLADKTAPWKLSQRLLERLESADVTLTLVKDGEHRLSKPHELRTLVRIADDLCRQVEESAFSASSSAASPARSLG